MDTSTIILTVGGGLVVGVIVLFIEYGYFQKRKKTATEITPTTTATTPAISANSSAENMSQPWIDVIYASAKIFCENQGGTFEDIQSMKIVNGKAHVEARLWTGNMYRYYKIIMDKTGDISEVDRQHY